MPHLLIAIDRHWQVGQRQRDALSILFRATPDDVRLIMNPKRLELGMYEEIPHLLTPIMNASWPRTRLWWAVREMEDRYKTLAAVGVRDVGGSNRNFKLAQAESKGPVLKSEGQ